MIRRNRVSHLVGRARPVYFRAGGSEWRLIGSSPIDPLQRWRKRSTHPAPVVVKPPRRPIKRKPPRTCSITVEGFSRKTCAQFLGVPYYEQLEGV